MAYQQIEKRGNMIHMAAKKPEQADKDFFPRQATAAQSIPDDEPCAELDGLMQQRMRRFEDHQIPEAEEEANQLAGYASGAFTPEEVKVKLGAAMDADFSAVRFHTGATAEQKAGEIGARAYTSGRDVYFGSGGFDPAVAAHELVHTAQQGMVDSGVATESAPSGGVQMLSLRDFGQSIGGGFRKAGQGITRAAQATGHGIARAAQATGHGFARVGRGIASGFSALKDKISPPVPYGPELGTPAEMQTAASDRARAESLQQLRNQGIAGSMDPRFQGQMDALLADGSITQMPTYSLDEQRQILDRSEMRKMEKRDSSAASRAAIKAKFGEEGYLGSLGRRAEALYQPGNDDYNDVMMDVIDRMNRARTAPKEQQSALYAGMQGDASYMQKVQSTFAPVVSETDLRAADIGAAEEYAEKDYYGAMSHTGKVHAVGDLIGVLPEEMRNQIFGGKDAYEQYLGKSQSLVTDGGVGAYSRGNSRAVKKFGFDAEGKNGYPVSYLRILRDFTH